MTAAQLEGHAAQDEGDEHQEQGEVESRKHRSVDVGESSEQRTASGDHPDFVAVPDGTDGTQDQAAVFRTFADEGEDHPYAVVKAF